MKWYALNKEYVNYLKRYDCIVPDIEYTGRLKCFLGVVLKGDNGIDYFAPLTSYKPKFTTMKNDIDFFKIVGTQGKIYGAIDINNMLPVSQSEYTEITLYNLPTFREFNNKREIKYYWKLLETELSCINEEVLLDNAEKLYRFVMQYPNSPLAQRCCNFSLLEEKCIEYNRVQSLLPELKRITQKEDLYYIYDNLDNKDNFENVVIQIESTEEITNVQELSREKINNFNRNDTKEINIFDDYDDYDY